VFLLYAVAYRWRVARSAHVEAGPATMELRDDPPAVVNLLVNELQLTPDAVAATILDLAARRRLEIFEVGPETSMLRVRGGADDGDLLAHERQLLDVARSAASADGVTTVAALSAALGPGSVRTWGLFSSAVRAAAVRAGLVRGRSGGKGVSGPSVAVATAVAVGFVVMVPPLFLVAGVVWPVTLVAAIVVLVWGHGQGLTPEGRAAAAHWLGVRRFLDEQDNLDDLPPGAVAVWDRYLAYGAATGQSGAAVRGLGDEVRTRMSLGDANRLRHMIGDPSILADEVRAQNQAELFRLYGPGTPADRILGPDDGDFWTLVERTAAGWAAGMRALVYDPAAWGDAVRRRLDALEAAAPSDIAADVAALAAVGRQAADGAAGGGAAGLQAAVEGLDLTAGPLAGPAGRLLSAAGAHFGCGPDPAALARRLGLADA
ncbi:MAG: hypothetical protein QOJ69_1657, partial [Actinomycetota bacterium]|nr:hypothetical protein [Actinomycetota bacterium]